MHPLTNDLEQDLQAAVGHAATQLHVGRYDLQICFGPVRLVACSSIRLARDGEVLTEWREGGWPGPEFYEVLDANVVSCSVASETRLDVSLKGGVVMQFLVDDDRYECLMLYVHPNKLPYVY